MGAEQDQFPASGFERTSVSPPNSAPRESTPRTDLSPSRSTLALSRSDPGHLCLVFLGVSDYQLRPDRIQELNLFPLLSMIQVPENDLQTAQGDNDYKGLEHGKGPIQTRPAPSCLLYISPTCRWKAVMRARRKSFPGNALVMHRIFNNLALESS